MGGSIFISYRRGEDAGFAGRLFDRLESSFQREALFMDVDSIAPGEDFVSILEARVTACDVVLALIGRGWLTATDAAGRRRLDNSDDFVRIEIASGLAQGKRVIPVLINDVAMPRAEELPEDLKPLVRRHGIYLSHERFKADAEQVIQALKQVLGDAEKARQVEEQATATNEGRQRQVEPQPQGPVAEAAPPAKDQALRQAEEDTRRKGEHQAEAAQPRRPPPIPTPPPPTAVADPPFRNWGRPPAIPTPPSPTERQKVEVAVEPRELPDLAVFRDVDAGWCPEMVVIPRGEFLMGSPENEEGRLDKEGPQHRVTIGYRFAMGRYPVTVGQYRRFVDATQRSQGKIQTWRDGFFGLGSGLKDTEFDRRNPGFSQGDQHPVVAVSWDDANAYAQWLSYETGKPYRLPSEAEWEYACRAGTTTRYAFGDEITEKLAFEDLSVKTTKVGAYPPNAWGLYDVHGNVAEWVEDVWHESYKEAPTDGSAWTGQREESYRSRVYRGDSYDKFFPNLLRSASRYKGELDAARKNHLRFRVARTLD